MALSSKLVGGVATKPAIGAGQAGSAQAVRDEMASAFRLHQSGDFAAAIRAYQGVVARDPSHADACHLLGVAKHQTGHSAEAVEHISRAVALRPGVPAFHANLAEAYRAIGQYDRAVGCCRTALHLWKEYPEAHNNLGLALQALGKNDEAVEHFRAAIALKPEDAMTHSNLATALRTLGKPDEALEHFRKAVELNPKLPQAQTNLGQFLLDLGKAEEALPHCREAVALQPDLAEAHNNLGNVHRALEQYTDARASYFEALRINPDLTLAHANLGLALQREGRLEEAMPWFRRATELEPTSVVFLGHLADAASESDQNDLAADCYKKMIEIDPTRPLSYNNLGWLIQEQGNLDEAQRYYETALALEPNFPPALISLGGLQEERGKLDGAEALFRKALEAHPGHTIALARLSTLLRGKMSAEDQDLLERRLEDATLQEGVRGTLLYGLAHVYDARERHDEAAECLKRANAASLAELEQRHQKYSPTEHERFVSNMIGMFTPDYFQRFQGVGLESRRPVFIIGLPRSGTTLIEQVLSSHSRVHGAGELMIVRQNFEAIPGLMKRQIPPLGCLPDLSAEVVRELAAKHDARLAELGGASSHVTDKMPDNYMYLGFIRIMFPNATFIHSRRDLRDVAVSCWMTNFRSIRWASDPEHIASRFQQYLRFMDHWKRTLPSPIHEIDYEESVENLEGVARRLVAACGLEWEPACLEFHKNDRPVRTASVTQVRQPVYKKSVARWKKYERSMADLFRGLPV